jgi:hypothetical protein
MIIQDLRLEILLCTSVGKFVILTRLDHVLKMRIQRLINSVVNVVLAIWCIV